MPRPIDPLGPLRPPEVAARSAAALPRPPRPAASQPEEAGPQAPTPVNAPGQRVAQAVAEAREAARTAGQRIGPAVSTAARTANGALERTTTQPPRGNQPEETAPTGGPPARPENRPGPPAPQARVLTDLLGLTEPPPRRIDLRA